MLTATYTLVALSVEQTNMRVSLNAVQQLVQKGYTRQSALTCGQAEYVCDTLRRLYEQCHRRKLDKFLLPALRRAGAGANPLLCELDMLSRNAAEALEAACKLLREGIDNEERVDAFCLAVERFCATLSLRFEREERELFPIARAAIAGEVWFAVANQMLAHDAYIEEHRPRPVRPASRAARADHAYRQGPPLSFAH
jgi:hemerythrin-like domain-containing protein